MTSTDSPYFSYFDSLYTSDARDAYLLKVWLKSRLFFLRLTHPVDDFAALMDEFETGAALKYDSWE